MAVVLVLKQMTLLNARLLSLVRDVVVMVVRLRLRLVGLVLMMMIWVGVVVVMRVLRLQIVVLVLRIISRCLFGPSLVWLS